MIRDAIRRRRGPGAGASAIDELAERLVREERARAQFVGKVSHELRTPLTVIKGYVYTLSRAESDPAKAAKLEVINGECERLAYLIEDLLELSRARAGELRVHSEAFRLERCVCEVAERMQILAHQRGIRVRVEWCETDGVVRGDEHRLRQVFTNLITKGNESVAAEGQRQSASGRERPSSRRSSLPAWWPVVPPLGSDDEDPAPARARHSRSRHRAPR